MLSRPPARALLLMILLASTFYGCGSRPPQPRSDAALGLNTQQARGRRVYDQRCGECHEAYSEGEKHGPPMVGLFRKPAMPSGTPANDNRVREVIRQGRAKMPGFGYVLDARQVEDLMSYLHTL